MVFVKATADSEAGILPPSELFEQMGRYNEALVDAGIMRGGDGLRPTSQARRVHFEGKQRTVTEGPFPETDAQVAGYWLWEVKDMDEAVAWVKRCPNPMMTASDIDIRPLYEASDFEALLTAEGEAVHSRVNEKLSGGGGR
jgi:hypothetical protein